MGVLEDRDERGQGEEGVREPSSSMGDPAIDPDDLAAESSEGSNEIEIPLVMPGRRGPSFWQRRARGIFLVAVAGLVLSTAWLLYDRFAADGTESRPAFSSVVDGGLTPEFRDVAGGFETMASRYRERMEDFDLGRLGCEGLWTGYRAVDEAFMSLSERYAAGRSEAANRVYEDSKRSRHLGVCSKGLSLPAQRG
jgi:hypothetical protein